MNRIGLWERESADVGRRGGATVWNDSEYEYGLTNSSHPSIHSVRVMSMITGGLAIGPLRRRVTLFPSILSIALIIFLLPFQPYTAPLCHHIHPVFSGASKAREKDERWWMSSRRRRGLVRIFTTSLWNTPPRPYSLTWRMGYANRNGHIRRRPYQSINIALLLLYTHRKDGQHIFLNSLLFHISPSLTI